MTPDPFGGLKDQPISLNKYLYASANPIMGADPSGLIDINLQSVLITTGIIGLLVGLYYAPSLFKAKTSTPRTVTVTITVSTANKPSTFNNQGVERRLQEFLDTKVFNNLLAGQRVQIQIRDSAQAPASLGWSKQSGLKTDYTGHVIWDNNIFLGGISYSQNNKTWIAPSRISQQLLQASGGYDWDYVWANNLAHEMIWLNAAGNGDNLIGSQKYEISRQSGLRLHSFNDVNPESRDELIADFDLRSKK